MAFSKDIHCTHKVGVFTKTAFNTNKLRLSQPVFFSDMMATGASLAGMMRWNSKH
jgi:hypothetical protein